MPVLAARDAERVLRFVADAEEIGGDDPFLPEVLRELGRLVPADWIGYDERDLADGSCLLEHEYPDFDEVYGGTAPDPSAVRHDNPLWRYFSAGEVEAIRLSDLLPRRALRRTRYYGLVLEPLGVTDRLAVAMPAFGSHLRRFSFDRTTGNFSQRDRMVLELLQPHLDRLWRAADTRRKLRMAMEALERASARDPRAAIGRDAGDTGLTPRERQILACVAQGKTNPQIAETLWIAPTTVRKHLENIYAKLGVRTRTAAVTHFLGVIDE